MFIAARRGVIRRAEEGWGRAPRHATAAGGTALCSYTAAACRAASIALVVGAMLRSALTRTSERWERIVERAAAAATTVRVLACYSSASRAASTARVVGAARKGASMRAGAASRSTDSVRSVMDGGARQSVSRLSVEGVQGAWVAWVVATSAYAVRWRCFAHDMRACASPCLWYVAIRNAPCACVHRGALDRKPRLKGLRIYSYPSGSWPSQSGANWHSGAQSQQRQYTRKPPESPCIKL